MHEKQSDQELKEKLDKAATLVTVGAEYMHYKQKLYTFSLISSEKER